MVKTRVGSAARVLKLHFCVPQTPCVTSLAVRRGTGALFVQGHTQAATPLGTLGVFGWAEGILPPGTAAQH